VKKMLCGMGMAFAMYSKIPMPDRVWKYGTPALTFCFFPMVGVVSGGLLFGWLLLTDFLSIGALLQGTGCVLISILVSGAIHFDGFCDTWDALGSHQSREKKLEILKDSHIGAFAAIYGAIYLLTAAALWGEVGVDLRTAGVLAYGLVEGDIRASGHLDGGYAIGPAARAGVYIDATPRWRLHPYVIAGRRVLGETGAFGDLGLEQRFTLGPGAAFTIEARRRLDFGFRESRVAAFLHLYF